LYRKRRNKSEKKKRVKRIGCRTGTRSYQSEIGEGGKQVGGGGIGKGFPVNHLNTKYKQSGSKGEEKLGVKGGGGTKKPQKKVKERPMKIGTTHNKGGG